MLFALVLSMRHFAERLPLLLLYNLGGRVYSALLLG